MIHHDSSKPAVKSNGEWLWLYAPIALGTKLMLDAQLFGRHGTDPVAAFLHGLREKHGLSEAPFLVDQCGSRTALVQLGRLWESSYCVESCCLTVVQRPAHQRATARFQEVLTVIVPVWRLERRDVPPTVAVV